MSGRYEGRSMGRSLLALLLTAVIACGAFPTMAFAATGKGRITFETNGGAYVEERNGALNEGLGMMPRTWYPDNEFQGWYTDEALSVPFDEEKAYFTADGQTLTLYAKFAKPIELGERYSVSSPNSTVTFWEDTAAIGQLLELKPVYPEGSLKTVDAFLGATGNITSRIQRWNGRFFVVLASDLLRSGSFVFQCRLRDIQPGELNEKETGTVYAFVSDDARFVTSDGKTSGTVMARVPLDLAEISKIDLATYGYASYNYDSDGDGLYEITLLHAFLYMLDKYYSGTGRSLIITGSSGSAFLNGFWGHDVNLTYYVNGAYPLEYEGWGATCDHIALKDGDFFNVSMYTDWSFYNDTKAGYHFFRSADGGITFDYQAQPGKYAAVNVGRAWGSLNDGAATEIKSAGVVDVYYAQKLYDQDNAESVQTDESGTAYIYFKEPGTYYLWVDGQPGDDKRYIVSAPAYAKMVVGGEAVVYGDVNGDGKISTADVIMVKAVKNGRLTFTDAQTLAADVNGNGRIDTADVVLINARKNGITVVFPVEK